MFDKDNVNEVGSLLDNPHVLVLHSSKTCDHCKKFEPVWKRLARRARRLNSELAFAEFDPEASPFAAKQLHPEVNVNGVPTIVYINKIKNKRVEYAGERTEQAIMEWLMKHSDKRIKITIETEDKDAPASPVPAPAAESFTDIPESFPAPVSPAPVSPAPVSLAPVSLAPDSLSAPDSFPESVSSDTFPESVSEPVSDSVSAAAAFPPPPAEAAPTSVVGTIKDAASSVNNAIGSTVEKAKNALTQDIDLSGLFAPAAATAAPAAAPAAATAAPAAAPAPAPAAAAPDATSQAPIQPVPQVPSLGGKKRKMTRRKHRRASSKKTKKSKSKSKK